MQDNVTDQERIFIDMLLTFEPHEREQVIKELAEFISTRQSIASNVDVALPA